jgi:formylglycine-generating enzyme
MSVAWIARALSVAVPVVLTGALGPGCGRTGIDEAYQASPNGSPDAASAGMVGPPEPLDAAGPALDTGSFALTAPSCATPAAGTSDCGREAESCCTTIDVPGGSFVRSYDGVSCPGGADAPPAPALGCYTSPDHPATISSFSLDKYLVTVARFQSFLDSVGASGWRPANGAGRHGHLNGGRGLVDVGAAGGFEAGWNEAWWDETLLEPPPPGDNGNDSPRLPVNGVTWFQAYAFCIWDGGFLPSEAEWNYAAAGGAEQRVYPWSVPPQSTLVDCQHAAYIEAGDPNACFPSGPYAAGDKSPAGDGRWSQADLAGNQAEWTLDWLRDYVDPCVDCANLQLPAGAATPSRAVRGYAHVGSTASPQLLTSVRGDDSFHWIGFRCAREPSSTR